MLHAQEGGEVPLEPFGIAAGGQPEIKGGVDQVADLPLVEHPAGIGDAVAGGERLLPVGMAVIGQGCLDGLLSQFFFLFLVGVHGILLRHRVFPV